METRVLRIDSSADLERAVQETAGILRLGGVAAVPTETVYGLAANALNETAVAGIYRAKGRPAHNPLIVHAGGLEMARHCAAEWPPAAEALARAFWPGPLTLVVPRSPVIPLIITAEGPTVALRWPSHPFMRKLIEACGFPLAAPSANRASEVSPTSAEHVLASLGGRIPLVVDAGPSPIGIESTVVEITAEGWRLLRPGMISAGQIEGVLHEPQNTAPAPAPGGLRSPGLLKKHYAPKAALRIISWHDDAELETQACGFGVPFSQIHILAHENIPQRAAFGRVAVIPHDPEAYARALYAELRQCDAAGAALILAEAVPPSESWDGIRDRLKRASADS